VTSSDSPYQPGEIIVSTTEIADVVGRLGRQISEDYEGRNPVLVNLLKGGVVFLADLIRQVSIPHQIDFLSVSSYGNGTNSSGSVRIVEDLATNIAGRDVLIVEDVLDTGRTLAYILDMLEIRSPKSLEVCALLSKKLPTQTGIHVKYIGKEIPDVFVVGYGLDYNEDFRHLPHVARLSIPGES
jgi:hypoxanthine phosphoribosyltransferase